LLICRVHAYTLLNLIFLHQFCYLGHTINQRHANQISTFLLDIIHYVVDPISL
jgi:hypothetical protein